MNSLKGLIYDHYSYNQPDSAITLCIELADFAKKSDELKWLGHSHNLRGISLNVQGQIAESMEQYERALDIFLDISNLGSQAAVMNNMANIFQDQGNHVRALEYYERALNIDESLGDSMGVAVTLMNIGIVHMTQGHFDQTLKFFLLGMQIAERGGMDNMRGPILNNLASVYHSMGRADSAVFYLERSLEIRKLTKDAYGTARVFSNMGEILLASGDTILALNSHLKSLSINRTKGYKENLPGNYQKLGNIHLYQKHFKRAELYGDSSLVLGQEMGNVNHMRDAANLLSRVYEAQGRPEEGWKMYRLFIEMRDSINSEEIHEATIKQQTKFDFEKALLIKAQKAAEVERLESERLRRRNQLQSALVLIGIILVFTIGMGVSRFNISNELSEGLVFLSFLILFEFLLILTDPYFEEWTNGAPAFKLIINAGLALVLIPLHRVFEKFMKRKLLKKTQ